MLVLAPVAAALIQLAISRTREFEADADGAELADDPLALAAALQRIEAGVHSAPLVSTPATTANAHLMIANPLADDGLGGLFRTHPPTSQRVRRLLELADERRDHRRPASIR